MATMSTVRQNRTTVRFERTLVVAVGSTDRRLGWPLVHSLGQLQCCSRIELAQVDGLATVWTVVQNRFQRAHNNNKVHKKMQRFIPLPLRPLYLLTLWDPLSCLTVRTTNSIRFAFSF